MTWARRLLAPTQHKAFWPCVLLLASAAVFWYASGFKRLMEWNIIDIAIGRNLLSGIGYVDFEGAPPAVWRSPLTPVIAGVFLMLLQDPYPVFSAIYTVFLSLAVAATYLWAKEMRDTAAGLIAGLLLLSSPALLVRALGIHGNSHTIVQPVFMACVVAGALFAFLAVKSGRRLHYVLTALFLGLAYLARSDGLLYLAAVILWLAIMAMAMRGPRPSPVTIPRVALLMTVFAATAAPTVWLYSAAAGKFSISGQSSYYFHASEGWVWDLPGDTEAEGYALAVRRYGSPEENGYSVLRAIARNPQAFQERLRANVRAYVERFFNDAFFPPVGIPFLAVGTIWCLRSWRSGGLLPLFGLLPNLTYLAFHVDPRYLTHSMPFAVIIMSLGCVWVGRAAWRFADGARMVRLVLVPVGAAAAIGVGWLWVQRAPVLWQSAHGTSPKQAEMGVAEGVRRLTASRPGQRPVIRVSGDLFGPVVAFYADARFSWGTNDEAFPRSVIYSMIGYPTVDMWVLDSGLYYRIDFGGDAQPADEYTDPYLGRYVFLTDRWANERFPIMPRVTLKVASVTDRDEVGCSRDWASSDGETDLVFRATVGLPRHAGNHRIIKMRVERSGAARGMWETSGPNYILGIAEGPRGALANGPGRSLGVPVIAGREKSLWLYACDDKPGMSDLTYRVIAELDDGATLESDSITAGRPGKA